MNVLEGYSLVETAEKQVFTTVLYVKNLPEAASNEVIGAIFRPRAY